MSMPTLALLTRSFRVDSRQMGTYYGRVALSAIILATLAIVHAEASWRSAPGLSFFSGVIFVDFFFISLAALSYFASAITEEKEEMALGLLRMTSLSPVSILLGKSASRVWYGITLLLAQFPFTILSVTLGGVSRLQIAAAYCALISYMLFASSLALFCSVACRQTKNAAGLTGLLLLGFFLLPAFGTPIVREMVRDGWIENSGFCHGALMLLLETCGKSSAFNRIMEIMQTGFSGGIADFQLASNLILCVLFFLLAWFCFDFFTRQQKEAAPGRLLIRRRIPVLRIMGAGRAWRMALIWKDFNFMAGGMTAAIIKTAVFGLVFLLMVWQLAEWEWRPWNPRIFGGAMMLIGLIAMGVGLAAHASIIFREEVKWQTLPDIMLLPISLRRLAYQKVIGCLMAEIPALLCFLSGALLAPGQFFDAAEAIFSEPRILLWVMSVAAFFLHLVVYLSLAVKRGAIALAFGITYIGGYLCAGVLVLLLPGRGSEQLMSWIGPLFLLGLAALLHHRIGARLSRAAAQ